jgi:hypothetical protein
MIKTGDSLLFRLPVAALAMQLPLFANGLLLIEYVSLESATFFIILFNVAHLEQSKYHLVFAGDHLRYLSPPHPHVFVKNQGSPRGQSTQVCSFLVCRDPPPHAPSSCPHLAAYQSNYANDVSSKPPVIKSTANSAPQLSA